MSEVWEGDAEGPTNLGGAIAIAIATARKGGSVPSVPDLGLRRSVRHHLLSKVPGRSTQPPA
jgi:hypothetical protein